jgi:hypothetical protein
MHDTIELMLAGRSQKVSRARDGDLLVADGTMDDGVTTIERSVYLLGQQDITRHNLRRTPSQAHSAIPTADAGAHGDSG